MNVRVSAQVLKPDYSAVIKTISDYESISLGWQQLGVGVATVNTAERDVALESLLASRQVVPMTFRVPGMPRWSGRVLNARGEQDAGVTGKLQITLVDERRILSKILAAPVPGQPWSNQTAGSHDVRNGPLATVARAYLTANLARLASEGRPVRMMVTPAPAGDTSPVVTLRARNEPIDELLDPVLRTHGYDMTVTLWLPGDPVPAGLNPTQATLIADVVASKAKPYVRFNDTTGGVDMRLLSSTHPQAMGVIVGGPGEDAARVFEKVMATDGRIAAMGGFGWPEEWLDASSSDTSALRVDKAAEKHVELAGTSAVSVRLSDRLPWKAGPDADYWVNDKVRARIAGVDIDDYISRVTISDTPEGYNVTSIFGVARENETPMVTVARKVGDIVRRLNAQEAGR